MLSQCITSALPVHSSYRRRAFCLASGAAVFAAAIQFFQISGDRDTLLLGQKGTLLAIPRQAFVDVQGQPGGILSINNEGTLYSFASKKDGYRNLPLGQDANIVAFSYKDNKPYFGKRKIKIPKDGQIKLSLVASTELAIKQDIGKLGLE